MAALGARPARRSDDRRHTAPRSHHHRIFVVLEGVKLCLLIVLGIITAQHMRDRPRDGSEMKYSWRCHATTTAAPETRRISSPPGGAPAIRSTTAVSLPTAPRAPTATTTATPRPRPARSLLAGPCSPSDPGDPQAGHEAAAPARRSASFHILLSSPPNNF